MKKVKFSFKTKESEIKKRKLHASLKITFRNENTFLQQAGIVTLKCFHQTGIFLVHLNQKFNSKAR
jgi:hypothetical protein